MSDEEDIFEQALRIREPRERRAFLDRACDDQPQLRQQIERLLQAHEQTSGILESPVVQVIDGPVSEQPGTLVGNYKLLEQIGEGGMGMVYMGEQLRPVKRRVALKILKPGLDTKQVIARFEAERQALAMMDHPNIARVFDAGVTDTGRPYFAMELVRGIPITQFCDEDRLTPRQRLELFVQVCQAVQHAHQKGIIHRDLKPSNVLVTLADDGKPVSKIIDFGIAKATGGQRLVDQTLFTEFRQLIGTPLYMSPEQAERSSLQDVDTRSDVYSLGVLLYELLTGTTPFDKHRLAAAAYDEVRRIIREEEPPRPSTRLSSLGQTVTSISAQRQTDPKKLSQTVRGELDWIVMKALEKDRARRYETATSLARDVERYLANLPVEAGPPSRTYRLRKFVRRNRAALAGCLLLAIALLSVGWAIYDRAERKRSSALQRAARQERTSTQLREILDEVARLETNQKWSEALIAARRAESVLASGEAAPEVEQRVRRALADLQLVHRLDETRARSGMAWGVIHFNRAERELPSRAERDYSAAFRDAGIEVDALRPEEAAARILSRRPIAIAVLPAMDDWVAVRRRLNDSTGVERLNAILRRADPDSWRQKMRDATARNDWAAIVALTKSADVERQPAATICFLAAAVWEVGGHPFRRERYLLQVDLLRRAQFRYPSDFWINHRLGVTLVFNVPGSAPEGIGYLRAAVAVRPDSGHAVLNLGNGYLALEQPEQAIACFRKAIELSADSTDCYYNLGNVLTNQGRYREAIDALQMSLQRNPGYEDALRDLIVCYTALQQSEKTTKWEQRLRSLVAPKILRDLPTTLPADPGQASSQLFRRATLYARVGEFSKTKADMSKALRLHTGQNARVWLACTELYLGNPAAYDSLRERFLIGDTGGTQYKLQLAEAGLLRPLSGEQLSNASKWIEADSASHGPSSGPSTLTATTGSAQLLLANGMLDYRRGDFPSADDQFARCIDHFNHLGPFDQREQSLEWATTAEFYQAMCLYQRSQVAEAQNVLTDARKSLNQQLGPSMYGKAQYGSLDWLIVHIAAREAEATIPPRAAASAAPSPSTSPAPGD